MSLEAILTTITKQATGKSETLVSDAHTQEKQLIEGALKSARDLKLQSFIDLEAKTQKKVDAAKKESTRRVQTALSIKKKEILNSLFLQAQEKLEAEFTESMAGALLRRLPQEAGDLHIRTQDAAVVKQALEKEKRTDKVHEDGTFAGIMYDSADVSVDLTIASLVKEIRQDIEVEVAKELFNPAA
jgi:vacuolar-type H+-ATPase subunit E/Vma4